MKDSWDSHLYFFTVQELVSNEWSVEEANVDVLGKNTVCIINPWTSLPSILLLLLLKMSYPPHVSNESACRDENNCNIER